MQNLTTNSTAFYGAHLKGPLVEWGSNLIRDKISYF